MKIFLIILLFLESFAIYADIPKAFQDKLTEAYASKPESVPSYQDKLKVIIDSEEMKSFFVNFDLSENFENIKNLSALFLEPTSKLNAKEKDLKIPLEQLVFICTNYAMEKKEIFKICKNDEVYANLSKLYDLYEGEKLLNGIEQMLFIKEALDKFNAPPTDTINCNNNKNKTESGIHNKLALQILNILKSLKN